MVSDTIRTALWTPIRRRYVTDVTIYTAHHRFMVRCSDSFPRSLDPLAIIYRRVLIFYRLDFENIYMLLTVSAMK